MARSCLFLALLQAVLAVLPVAYGSDLNIYGEPLAKCDRSGIDDSRCDCGSDIE
jgi:hypothetical protein